MDTYKCWVFKYSHGLSGDKAGWTKTELDPVDEVLVRGRSDRAAAAEAYVLSCGIKRAHYMRYELNAPVPVILFEIDVANIARELQEGTCWAGKCFYLDHPGGFEIFYVVLEDVEL